MLTKAEIMNALKRPFEEKQISWRVGSTNADKTSGIALAYIDARDVMRRLDDVMGMDWQNRHYESGGKTFCDIGLKIDGEWLWRSGGAGDSDIEAEKGAISDSFKRAAVLWGVGQYLYSLPNQWFDLVPAGKSYKLAGTPTLPKWATPTGWDEAIAKKARITGEPVKVTKSVWDSLDYATQVRLQGMVDEARHHIENDRLQLAIDLLNGVSDPDERVAMESRFTSQERTLISSKTKFKG